jgi:hypothetical protein
MEYTLSLFIIGTLNDCALSLYYLNAQDVWRDRLGGESCANGQESAQ